MSEGNPDVARVPCTIEDVVGIDECVETYGIWVCKPYEGGSAEYQFNVVLSDDGKVCTIQAVSVLADETGRLGDYGGGEFGGGGAGGED